MTERFTNFIKREILVSEAGESCGSVFDTNDVGLMFFESVWKRFTHFDYMHRKSSKPLFYDVDYIIKRVTADLKSEKFAPRSSQRLDSYLYIYRLLHAYALTLGKFHDPLHEFKQCLFDRLASIFVATNGKEPNLLIRDTFHLRKMDIPEHLSSFTSIRDQKMLETFFVLVKLSMQSARMIDDGRQRFIWLDTLPKVREINFYFDEFIRSYVKYQLVFEKDPIDTPEFIYLAGRIRLPKEQEPTYILTLAQLHTLVQPAAMKFVTRFPPLFEICVRANRFHMDDIIQFFQRICKHEQWLRKYLSVYASNTTTSYLWEMFVRLSKIANLRDATQEEFAPFLIDKVSDVVAPSFDRYTLSFKATLLEIPTESRSKFTETFAKIFDAFIVKQMQIPFSVYGLTRTDCKKLLKLGLEISSVELQQNTTCLRLLRRLICETESYQKSSLADKLQCLFRNLNFLDEDLSRTYAPEQLIDDEWLKDFLIGTTQHWLKLDEDTYTHLCRRLSNERWTTYVWSRIMHMSLAKLANENPYDILVQLNDWMKRVHRHTYDPEDTFTLIFVGKLFDLIIAKLPRALSSLPKIDAIMNVLLPLRDSHAGIVNVVELNNFIKTAQGVIVEILHFKSKFLKCRSVSLTDVRCL